MSSATSTVAGRLSEAGIVLPEVEPPSDRYIPLRRHGRVVYCAGVTSDGIAGRLGEDLDIAAGRRAADLCARRQLAYLSAGLESLDEIELVIRLTGYVRCTPDFSDPPKVIDAASEVFLAAFGEAGQHVRTAIGVTSLPGDWAVELETIVAVRGE